MRHFHINTGGDEYLSVEAFQPAKAPPTVVLAATGPDGYVPYEMYPEDVLALIERVPNVTEARRLVG